MTTPSNAPHQGKGTLTPYQWFLAYLTVSGAKHVGKLWQCPAHEDSDPSMSVSRVDNDVALFHCFSGCTQAEVLAALGLSPRMLRERSTRTPREVLEALQRKPSYASFQPHSGAYRALGAPVSTVYHEYIPNKVRLERNRYSDGSKTCAWETKRGKDWYYGLGSTNLADLPLYRWNEVQMALGAGEPIILCESESSVDACFDAGMFATTWAGGAGAVNPEQIASQLKGARIILVPDNDPEGVKCGEKLRTALEPVARVAVVMPLDGKDARDMVIAGVLTLDRVMRVP